MFLSKFHYICIEVLAAKNRNSTKYKNIYVIIDFQRVEFTVISFPIFRLLAPINLESAEYHNCEYTASDIENKFTVTITPMERIKTPARKM